MDATTRGIQPGGWRLGTWTWSDGSAVSYAVEPDPRWGMRLRIEWRRSSDERKFSQRIALLERRTPTGGLYSVAVCPESGDFVRKLYLSSDASAWAGRSGLGLKHPSTAESEVDRAFRRLRKVEDRLKARGCWRESDRGWRRPKHCRRDWFERARCELAEASTRADEAFFLGAVRAIPKLRHLLTGP